MNVVTVCLKLKNLEPLSNSGLHSDLKSAAYAGVA